MVRVERVFKEKEYKKQNPRSNEPGIGLNKPPTLNLEGLTDDLGSVLAAVKNFPVKSTLTVIGAITVLYICFKMTRKFGSIKANLKKI